MFEDILNRLPGGKSENLPKSRGALLEIGKVPKRINPPLFDRSAVIPSQVKQQLCPQT